MNIFAYTKMAYNNLSYRKKLLYSYLILVFIPMIILSVYFYIHTTAITQKNANNLSLLHLEYTTTTLSDTFSEMMSLAKTVSSSRTIRDSLDKEPPERLMEHSYDLDNMRSDIERIHYDSDIYSIRLFVNDELPYAKNSVFTWPLSRITELFQGKDEQIYELPAFWGPTVVQYPLNRLETKFSLTLPIHSYSDYDDTFAIVCIDVSQEHLIELMKTSDFSQKGTVLLTDPSGNPLLGYSNASQELIAVSEYDTFPVSKNITQIKQDGSLISMSPQIWNSYHLVIVTPLDELNQNHYLFLQLLLYGTIIGYIIYLLASLYSRFNTKRITQLSQISQKVQQGNLDVHCIVDSSDEIGELQITFNAMIYKMQHMLDEQYQLGCHIKDQELKLLQAQIDPHFLYNTLDLITWTAQNKSADEVCDIVLTLSQYYRISLSKGLDIIPIENELKHAALYVQLQNKRFENRIHFTASVCPEAAFLSLPKFLLQPLVENSIIHGFNGIQEKIHIDVAINQDYFLIIVEDNGIGITPDKLTQLRLHQELTNLEGTPNGYGLFNIQERLRNCYGPQAYIDFDSKPAEGTIVKIIIPRSAVESRK